MSFTPQFLNELRDRVDLASIIGRHVKLTKRGREFVGLSPFKAEKTPSFTVVPEKGFYHDFASGEHGDIIDFVMKVEGLSFPEAVEKLCGEAGLEVPRHNPEEAERAKRRQDLYGVLELACNFFERQLRMPEGAAALAYLEKRGLSEQTIKTFRLGYAPDHAQALKNSLARENITENQMIEGGLRKQSDSGDRAYDYFRGRVMFPIADKRGRILGFGARIMGEGQPKYLNSPETPLFQKGRVLYGLHQANRPARDQDQLLVTEGYMDVIGLAQGGFPHAVAPLGTALTEDQIKEAWRLAPEPVVCFDGDSAGAKAAMRAAERVLPLLKAGHGLRFATLPLGEDPDSLIAKQGKPAMQAVITGALPLSEFIWNYETGGQSVTEPGARAALNQRLDDHLRRISDPVVRKHYKQAFYDRLFAGSGRSERGPSIRSFGQRPYWGRDGVVAAKEGVKTKINPQDQDAKVALALLLKHPEFFPEAENDLGFLHFDDPALEQLRQAIIMRLSLEPTETSEVLCAGLSDEGCSHGLGLVFGDDLVRQHLRSGLSDNADHQELALIWSDCRQGLLTDSESDVPPGPNATEEDWERYMLRRQSELGDR